MMKEVMDIILFDIEKYALLSDTDKYNIIKKLKNLLLKYNWKNLTPIYNSTGDGYYIGIKQTKKSFIVLLNLISYLLDNVDEVNFRFALHTGSIKREYDINNNITMIGKPLDEMNRLLTGIKSGNIILASRQFYETHIGGNLVIIKFLAGNNYVLTHQKIDIECKHTKKHEAYSITYQKGSMSYGLEFTSIIDGIASSRIDQISHNSFKSILESAFKNCIVSKIIEIDKRSPNIGYSYYMVELTKSSTEYFLFVKNDSIKTQLLKHFNENNECKFPLTICVNRKGNEITVHEFWKKDFLNKFENTFNKANKFVNFYFINDFIWEHCVPSSLKQEDEYSHEKNYISPAYKIEEQQDILSKSAPVDAETYLLNWIESDNNPIGIVYGIGGIGKTTILKIIADKLKKREKERKFVFFIEGRQLAKSINQVEDTDRLVINSVSDLVRLHFSNSNYTYKFGQILDEEIFDIIFSSGTLVIFIDGLDEIASALKGHFDLKKILQNIVSINQLLNHCKIIISTRDYYWNTELSLFDSSYQNNFFPIELIGFDENMALHYFRKGLKNTSDINKAMHLLKSFSKKLTNFYVPFVALVVTDILLRQEGLLISTSLNSKYMFTADNFDFIIMNVCGREQTRQLLNMEIDDFLELFKEIIFEYDGNMPYDSFVDYVDEILSAASIDTETATISLLNNMFIGEENGYIKMCYDFVQDHLITAFATFFIKNGIVTNKIIKILSRYCNGNSDIIKRIATRMRREDIEKDRFIKYFKYLVSEASSKIDISKENIIFFKTIAFFLYLSFEFFDSKYKNSKSDRMELLDLLYENNFDQLHIYGDFYPLDFSGRTIRNSSFNNFHNFVKSDFDNKTKFIDTQFHDVLPNNVSSVNTMISPDIFDISCKLTASFKMYIHSSEGVTKVAREAIKKDLKTLFRTFYDGGQLRGKREDHLPFSTSSCIDSKTLIKEMLNSEMITNTYRNPPYNWGITQKAKDSTSHLVFDNFSDVLMDNVIEKLFSKYYV